MKKKNKLSEKKQIPPKSFEKTQTPKPAEKKLPFKTPEKNEETKIEEKKIAQKSINPNQSQKLDSKSTPFKPQTAIEKKPAGQPVRKKISMKDVENEIDSMDAYINKNYLNEGAPMKIELPKDWEKEYEDIDKYVSIEVQMKELEDFFNTQLAKLEKK